MRVKRKRPIVQISLLAVIILGIVVAGSGCVSGLAPIGWSGGTVANNTMYIGSREGRLVAINLADESRQFTEVIKAAAQPGLLGCSPATGSGCSPGSTSVPVYGTPIVAGDLVYFAGYNGKIYAYSTNSLAARWVYPREGYLKPIVGGLVAAGGKLFIGGSDGNVYALDATTGDKLWEFPTGDKIWSTPVVDSGTLYIGSFDKKMYALDTADGRKKWEYATGGAIIATPLVAGGTVYIGSFDRNLYAVNAADGRLKWQFAGQKWFWAEPVLVNGTIYAGNLDGKVYALKADTGSQVAALDLKNPLASRPVVVGDNAIFATRKGEVYAVNTVSRAVNLLVALNSEVDGPLTAEAGTVYVHLQDLTLQRINATTGALLRPISLKS